MNGAVDRRALLRRRNRRRLQPARPRPRHLPGLHRRHERGGERRSQAERSTPPAELDRHRLRRSCTARRRRRLHAGVARQTRALKTHRAGRPRRLLFADGDARRQGEMPGFRPARHRPARASRTRPRWVPASRPSAAMWNGCSDRAPIAPLLDKLDFTAGERELGISAALRPFRHQRPRHRRDRKGDGVAQPDIALSALEGGEGRVRWVSLKTVRSRLCGAPRPSHRCAMGPSLSPLRAEREGYSAAAFASWMARHTRSGVAGISTWRTPSSDSASTTALITAPSAGVVPPSPPGRMP